MTTTLTPDPAASGTPAATLMPAESRPSRRTLRRRARRDEDGRQINWWITALLMVCSLTVLVPLYFTVVTALKTPDQLGGTGFELPTSIHLQNFVDAWNLTNFPRALMNTALITVGSVLLTLATNSMVAYAIARNMHRKFFKGIYFYLVSAIFVPFPIIMLPVVKQTALMGLDNQAGLILLYTVFGLSTNTLFFVAFIRSIPEEMEEAALLDGATTWVVFRKIIFPLLSPMLATVGILTCVWAWNDFILPLVVLSDPSAQTLPLANYVFQGQFNTNYTAAFASYLMAMAPLLLVYLFAQRWVISGVMRGSIK